MEKKRLSLSTTKVRFLCSFWMAPPKSKLIDFLYEGTLFSMHVVRSQTKHAISKAKHAIGLRLGGRQEIIKYTSNLIFTKNPIYGGFSHRRSHFIVQSSKHNEKFRESVVLSLSSPVFPPTYLKQGWPPGLSLDRNHR